MHSIDKLQIKRCHNCKKYISFNPAIKNAAGHTTCGRCFDILREIPPDIFFPCINAYSGCKARLYSADVLSHENSCQFFTPYIQCPECAEPQQDSLILLDHLETKHHQQILPKNEHANCFELSLPTTATIYIDAQNILQILYSRSLATNEPYVLLNPIFTSGISFDELDIEMEAIWKAVSVSEIIKPVISSKFLKVFILPSDKGDSVHCRFKISNAISENVPSENLEYIISRILGENLDKNGTAVIADNKLIPSFCHICCTSFYAKGVYKCEDNLHFICSGCHNFNIEKCCNGKMYVEATDENKILRSFDYMCRWKCGGKDRIDFINRHEIECDRQIIRKCPVSRCTILGTLRHIFLHFQRTHSFTNIKCYDYWYDRNNQTYYMEDLANGKIWYYFVSNLFVAIYCTVMVDRYDFTMSLCEKSVNVDCHALIKYDDKRGQLVTNKFSVPIHTKKVDIKVILLPKGQQLNVY